MSKLHRWVCSQIGAREHYAVPRALQQSGRLAAFCTDFWAGPLTRTLAKSTGAAPVRALATRYHPALAGGSTRVVSWNARALGWEVLLRRKSKGADTSGRFEGYAGVGHKFGQAVKDFLSQLKDLPPDAVFFSYDTGALETMEWCRERGIKCVLGQMDPGRVEAELVRAEAGQWPGWETRPLNIPEVYFQRREQEWKVADRVMVNSDFSRDALLQQGVPAEKLVVVPLCYELGSQNSHNEDQTDQSERANKTKRSDAPTLHVLFFGQVILRKGIQYLIQAAKELAKENIVFDVVGSLGISAEAVRSAPPSMKFHGHVSRDQASAWYRQADVFVLPTLSDGFALTQLEAMAHGVPVVATPCCGAVVSDGVDGFIIPPRDPRALADSLRRYLADANLLPAHRAAALQKSRQFTLDRLAANLQQIEAALYAN